MIQINGKKDSNWTAITRKLDGPLKVTDRKNCDRPFSIQLPKQKKGIIWSLEKNVKLFLSLRNNAEIALS